MRFTRVTVALVAAFTAIVLGFTTVPAQAAKPRHDIDNFSAGETSRDGVFYAKGLAYTAKGQRIYLQSARKGTNKWSTRKSTVADRTSGRFVFRFGGLCNHKYRIYIKGDAQQTSTAWFNYGIPDGKLHSYFGTITC